MRDNLSWSGTWDIPLGAVTVPVDPVYGESDQMVPAYGRRLAELLPHATSCVMREFPVRTAQVSAEIHAQCAHLRQEGKCGRQLSLGRSGTAVC